MGDGGLFVYGFMIGAVGSSGGSSRQGFELLRRFEPSRLLGRTHQDGQTPRRRLVRLEEMINDKRGG